MRVFFAGTPVSSAKKMKVIAPLRCYAFFLPVMGRRAAEAALSDFKGAFAVVGPQGAQI
jgi:hypothetical protein